MHPLVPSVLLGVTRLGEFGMDAKSNPPDGQRGQTRQGVVAKGTPLSVRMICGSPYLRNSRVKTLAGRLMRHWQEALAD